MRNLSKKRAAEYRQYWKVRKAFLEENPYCKRCGKPSQDLHHSKGKIGKLLLDTKYFIPLCRIDHTWVELSPKEAKEQGYSVSRLEK